MAVLSAQGLFNSDKRSNNRNSEDFVPSELWLNIGIMVDTVNPDTGETEKELLSLPINLAIDTMRKREVPTRKPTTAKAKQFRDRAIASNELLEFLQQAGAGFEPGQVVTLEGFTMQLQRVNERESDLAGTDPNDNPYLAQISSQFGIGDKKEAS